jgi:uncharacterized protein YbjT (DUF2867 family)
MKVAVTTPTGNIGKVVADELVTAGAQVILLARNPDKVKALTNRGASVVQGSQEDREYVARATRGVDAFFWLIPPDYSVPDLRAYYNRVGEVAVAATQANRIGHIVFLSSVGAHQEGGTGPILGLRDVEQKLERVALHITHLRPAAFFENYLWQFESIKHMGKVFLPVSGSTRVAMVATQDIGRVAAKRLLDTTWTGRSVANILGPSDLSFDEAAAGIGRGIGKLVTHVQVPEDQARQAMKQAGMGDDAIGLMLKLYRAMSGGLLKAPEGRTVESTTPTTIEQFARNVLKPMIVPVS